MMAQARVLIPAAGGEPVESATADYRRRARRLRQEHRRDPQRLMRSLQALSARADAAAEREARTPASETVLGRRFAMEVVGRMDGGVLRYSARVALLKRAEELGIGRFEANLLMAMVVHAAKGAEPAKARPRRRWMAVLGVIVLVEGLIGLGAWWVLRGL